MYLCAILFYYFNAKIQIILIPSKFFLEKIQKITKKVPKWGKINQKTTKMSGKELKERLAEKGVVNISKLAEMLGQSNQRLHASMSSPDVKSGLIEEIAQVLGVDVADFYPSSNMAITNDGIAVAGNGNNVTISEKVLDLMREKDKQIDRLLTIIETK